MALPVEISSDVANQNSYHGPFKSSGGGFYTVLRGDLATDDGTLEAFKADANDPTDAFTEQDGANTPSITGSASSVAVSVNVFQNGDDLHCVGVGTSDDYHYARFDMSSDTWQDVDGVGNPEVEVDNLLGNTSEACDIAVLSASYGAGSAFVKIRVVYQGAVGMDMGSSYERVVESNSVDDGVNWSAPTTIDNSASVAGVHYTGPRIVLPPSNSDQCHIFMSDGTNLTQRAIAGDDTLRTYRDTGFNVDPDTYPISHGIGFSRSSVSKVRVGFINFSFRTNLVLEFDAFSDDTDRSEGASSVSGSVVQVDNNSINSCLAADGSIIRGLMVKSAGDDLFEFFDDDADSYTLQGSAHRTGTVNHISTNVYDRSGPKLAMIYDDGGTVYYDEISLGAGATTISVPQDSLSETDQTPALRTGVNVPTPQDSLTQTDNDPALNTGVNVPVPQDALTETDNAPTVPQIVGVPQDSLSQTDNDPDIYTGATVGVPVDAQTQTDYDPGISTGASVPVPQDSQAVTDNAPTVPQIVGVPADSLSVADQAPDIRTGATVVVPADAQTVTDNVPIIRTSIGVPQDSLSQTDNDPDINTGVNVAPPADALSETDNILGVGTGAIVDAPQDAQTVVDNDPALNTGVTVEPPLDSLAQNDNAPEARTGVLIQVPVDTLSVVDNAPVIGTSTRVDVPADGLSVADQVPVLNTGVNVAIPANDNLTLSTFAPVIIAVVVTTSGTRRQRQSKSLTRSRRRRR